MKQYAPEMGQAMFGNPTGRYELPEYAEAMLFHIFKEIERMYWNNNQAQWENYQDPGIPGIEVRPYYWGNEEDEKDRKRMELPNFQFERGQIRWYKYPGRGMSC